MNHNRIISSLLFLLIFASVSSLHAQIIRGRVLDAQTKKPLAGANVIQPGTTNGISTDSEGAFSLSLTKNESPTIRVSFLGYKTQTIDTQSRQGLLSVYLQPKKLVSNEVIVDALRADKTIPMAYSNVSRKQIEEKNLGQDMPAILSSTPSVTTTSDAGTGIGYSSLRIRGVDQGRINVTINGVPVNDAESHGVFWVDIPDLASSVQNIQIQRGVGTSSNGAAAFGGSVNIQTSKMEPQAYGKINTVLGSFNTRKANVELGSGLMKNGWQFSGRLSKITSDGYIDRASSDLKSFYLSAAKHGDQSLLRADVFSGKEQTYQSWYGVSQAKLDSGNRTYNPAGTEKKGDPYENETDNYQQDNYQLHYSYQLMNGWEASAALHYTYGRGYYEEYKAQQMLDKYQINPVQLPDTTINKSDLIRDLWLRNKFYGLIFSTNYKRSDRWSLTLGGGYNEYDGDHFGEVKWARFASDSEIGQRYYFNNGFKTDFNTYLKGKYYITQKLTVFADAQIRHITYRFTGKDQQPATGGGDKVVDVRQSDALTFFNPKGGFTYNINNHQRAFLSLSVAGKEPAREEYVNSSAQNRPKAERLYDWEAGYKISSDRFSGGITAYFMNYNNQLVLTGRVNDVGANIRQNVPESYRAGIELQASARLLNNLKWSANATFSRNKIKAFTYYLDNYDTDNQEAQKYKDTDISFSPDAIAHSALSFTESGFEAQWSAKVVSRQYLDNTQSRSRSLDPYIINNLRLSYGWSNLHFLKNVKATLLINNILSEQYESNGYTYGYISGGKARYSNYYFPQAPRNFLLQLSLRF